jgi:hypothetical protein
MSHKKSNAVSQIVTDTFHPFPAVKRARTCHETQVIYDAAHYLFRKYPLHKPLCIYKHQLDQCSYDFYIERTESGWNDMVYIHSVTSNDNPSLYVVDGLSCAIKEEKEIKPLLWHMAQQIGMMRRLLNL